MATDLYCSRGDVARRLPPGAISSLSGIAASSSISTDVFRYDGHGFETGDPVQLRAIEGTGALPDPLLADTTYYTIRVSNSDFQLSALPGGPPIDLTSESQDVVVIREPNFDDTIEFYSRWADTFLPAAIVPLQAPIHPLVRGLVADLSAKRTLNESGQDSAIVNAAELAAKAQLERFVAGLPLRAPETAPANLAVSRPLPSTGDPRGWGSGRLP